MRAMIATVLTAGVAAAALGAPPRWAGVLEQMPGLTHDPFSVLVQFDVDTPLPLRDLAVASVGGRILQEFTLVPGLAHVEVAMPVEQALERLSTIPGVVYAEPDYLVHTAVNPNDSSFGQLWGLHNTGQTVNGDPGVADADIDAPEAWDIFTGDPNFVIAVIDSGVNYNHTDLAANSWINPGEVAGNGVDDDGNGYVDDVRGWDFYNNDNNPMDDNGHGTHCAGTIGGVGNNGTGVAGVNWRCKIMALKFLGAGGSGSTSGAISAVQYLTGKAVRVSNNSWGGGGSSSSLSTAIANSRSVGHVFCAAAGNNGTNNDSSPFYPASYPHDNIIAVAATDNNDNRASFSNYGATSVDVGAPGVNIYSTYGSGYAFLNGTSMATPHVAGLAGLITGRNPQFSYSQVRDTIMSTVRPVGSLSGRTVTGGVINAASALGGGGGGGGGIPNAPTNPGVTSPRNLVALVTWTDNASNETTFEIQREQRINRTWTNTVTVGSVGANVTSFEDTLTGAGSYRYRIRAKNANGSSVWTAWVSRYIS